LAEIVGGSATTVETARAIVEEGEELKGAKSGNGWRDH
jgi:hypothetical protein